MKDFIKITSFIATIICMISFSPATSAPKLKNGMIPIVFGRDSLVIVGGEVDTARVQQMVDSAIIYLTGITDDLPLAYQCIFPAVFDTTKILIKYNPTTPEFTRKPLCEAIKKGLCRMLNGTFSPSNITIIGDEGTASTTDTVIIDTGANTHKFLIKDPYVKADWIIYVPSAWGTSMGCGVQMCLQLMTSSVEGIGGATMNDIASHFVDTLFPSLSILNYHPVFNGDDGKTCLYILDLLSYSGTGQVTNRKEGYRIYATQNITVCDWKGVRFLYDSVGAITAQQAAQARKVCSLSVAPIDLGVVNEGQMYEVQFGYNEITSISTVNSISANSIRVNTNPSFTMFTLPGTSSSRAMISIYDILGREIWSQKSSGKNIVWHNKDANGLQVVSGAYLYQVKAGKTIARGITTIKK